MDQLYRDLFYHEDRKIERKTNKKEFYVKNEDLENETLKCIETDVPSTELAKMFQKLAYRVSFMPAFRYDTTDDRNDCVQHAVMVMLNEYRKYDITRGKNCFSFFTSVAVNGLRQGWNILKKNAQETLRFDMIFEESI